MEGWIDWGEERRGEWNKRDGWAGECGRGNKVEVEEKRREVEKKVRDAGQEEMRQQEKEGGREDGKS